MIKSFVCVCTGNKYSPSYVNTLYNMVERNSNDVQFHAITDSHKPGFNKNIKTCKVRSIAYRILKRYLTYERAKTSTF